MNSFIISILGLFMTVIASAGDWQHINLRSNEDVRIRIDYTLERFDLGQANSDYIAGPIWFHVGGAALKPTDQVRVVLVSGSQSRNIDLYFENGNFTGSLSRLIAAQFRCSSPYQDRNNPNGPVWYCNRGASHYNRFGYEMAVVVNGTWLVDPITLKHNFSFML